MDNSEDHTSNGPKKIKTGSFQTMGLEKDILKGLLHMGYKTPTPVQRKALPIALAGMDMVCMARTGSGKTCAFLLPMIQKLKCHNGKSGVRAIVLSPTRELATQTLKFAKDMAKHTDLRIISVVGGDSMEEQFESLSSRPDVIIGTPGRLMHQIREISTFKLKSVKYLVFDEADRLFEMGFAEQLNEIIRECPAERQTLLFSATLPKMLIQFTRAGLRDPQLIRLDTDTKLSDELRISFFFLRSTEKVAALLYLVRRILPSKQLTIVFTATRHHSEFIHTLFEIVGITSTLVYGSMDQEQRAANLRSFRNGEVSCMVVTDLAARGIDVPLLDNVINFHFPPSPKLFVHRCGRVARQGRVGFAMSLIEPEELAYMADVHNFLGRDVSNRPSTSKNQSEQEMMEINNRVPGLDNTVSATKQKDAYTFASMSPEDVHTGLIPQDVLDEENELIKKLLLEHQSLAIMWRVCENAMKQYRRTRPEATHAGVKLAKSLVKSAAISAIHPLIVGEDPIHCNEEAAVKAAFVKHLQTFRPAQTVLETGIGTGCTSALKKGSKRKEAMSENSKESSGVDVMKALRAVLAPGLERNKKHVVRDDGDNTDIANSKYGDGGDYEGVGDGVDDEEEEEEGDMHLDTDEFDVGDAEDDVEADEGEVEVSAAATHVRLSKHERKKLKAKASISSVQGKVFSKPDNSTMKLKGNSGESSEEVTVHEEGEAGKKRVSGSSFRDSRFYMTYGNEDVVENFAEESMQPQYGLRNSELINAYGMERALLDVTPDEALEMNKKRRLLRWDARKRKFVKQSLEEMSQSRGAKRVRTETGVLTSKSAVPQGELYKKWKAKSHREVNTGPSEGDFDDGPRPNVKVNRHVRDEIRTAPEIRKLQDQREKMKLKNMSKEKRTKILGKSKKSFKDLKAEQIQNMPRKNSRSKVFVRR